MKAYAMTDSLHREAPHDAAPGGEHEAISTATARTFAILDLVAHSPVAVEVASVIEELWRCRRRPPIAWSTAWSVPAIWRANRHASA